MHRCLSLVLATVLLAGTTHVGAYAQNDHRDGNYWVTAPPADKLSYVVGFFDGMLLGRDFSYWAFVKDPSKGELSELALSSFNQLSTKYFSNVTSGQLVDGLNRFYADFQNRRIKVPYGVWLVVNQIAGTPDVDKMILSFRQNADR